MFSSFIYENNGYILISYVEIGAYNGPNEKKGMTTSISVFTLEVRPVKQRNRNFPTAIRSGRNYTKFEIHTNPQDFLDHREFSVYNLLAFNCS